jgi:hypothetical protein
LEKMPKADEEEKPACRRGRDLGWGFKACKIFKWNANGFSRHRFCVLLQPGRKWEPQAVGNIYVALLFCFLFVS